MKHMNDNQADDLIIAEFSVDYDFDPGKKVTFIVVTDEELYKVNTGQAEIIPMDVPIADAAMKAFAEGKSEFICNSSNVKLLGFKPTESYDEYSPYPRPDRVNGLTEKHKLLPVYLYRTFCTCIECKKKYGFNDIISVRAYVLTVTGQFRLIEVEKCKFCGSYFVSEVSLTKYEEEFGTLMIHRSIQPGNPDYESDSSFFAPDSVLSRHGYYVSQEKNPGDRRRQEILWMLLHNGIARKAEIKGILNNFLLFRSDSQKRAKAIWREDLNFLDDLDSGDIERDTFLFVAHRKRW